MFDRSYDDVATVVLDTLTVATWTFLVSVCGLANPFVYEKPQYETIVVLEDKGPCMWKFSPTSRTQVPSFTECLGIPLYHTAYGELYRELYVLVIQEVKIGVYERVGFGQMTGDIKTVIQHFGIITEEEELPIVSFEISLPNPRKEWK